MENRAHLVLFTLSLNYREPVAQFDIHVSRWISVQSLLLNNSTPFVAFTLRVNLMLHKPDNWREAKKLREG